MGLDAAGLSSLLVFIAWGITGATHGNDEETSPPSGYVSLSRRLVENSMTPSAIITQQAAPAGICHRCPMKSDPCETNPGDFHSLIAAQGV